MKKHIKNKIEDLHREHSKYWDSYNDVPLDINHALLSANITKDISMRFSEFCRDNARREGFYGDNSLSNNWELNIESKIVTTEQLFEMFLKTI